MESKKVQWILVLVLLVIMLGMLFYWSESERENSEKLNQLNEYYSKYDVRIKEIENRIEKKKKEISQREERGKVVLAFSEENPQLTETILPELKKRGFLGTVVLKTEGVHQENKIKELMAENWDIALGGKIGEESSIYVEKVQRLLEECKSYTENPPTAYFFNGKEYGRGSSLLYPSFEELSLKMSVAFASNTNILTHGQSSTYADIEECQNVSARWDFSVVRHLIEQAIEKNSVLVLSDFGEENQMEIAEEDPLENLEKVLDFIEEKREAGELQVGNIRQYLDGVQEEKADQEERIKEYEAYEKKCREEIEKIVKERDDALAGEE